MILSGIHGFKSWIPDYPLGNDNHFVDAEAVTFFCDIFFMFFKSLSFATIELT